VHEEPWSYQYLSYLQDVMYSQLRWAILGLLISLLIPNLA
jgi:hypothetical protein